MPSIDISRFKDRKKPAELPNNRSTFNISELLNREFTFGNGQLKEQKKEQFYTELGALLTAGIDLKSSLELVVNDHKKQDLDLFIQIKNAVVQGSGLSGAMARTGKFSNYEVFSIEIGEETGKLNEVLADISTYYKNKISQRRKITSALTYPIVVLATCLGAVVFMIKLVVPMFGDIFKRLGGELPWITRKMISFSEFIGVITLPLFILLLCLGIFLFTQRKNEQLKKTTALIILKIPFAGELVKKIYLARWCNCMRLLINARLPLLRSIALSRQMINFYPITESLEMVEKDILLGKHFYESLKRFNIYPPKMIQLVKIGEETNRLDYFFEKIAEQYVEEIEFKTSTLTRLMEPLIIIFLGLIVGIILISMYLPLFQMGNSLQ